MLKEITQNTFQTIVGNLERVFKRNPLYIVVSFIYLIIATLMFGGNIIAFFFLCIAYVISLAIALSDLGEKILRLIENVRPLETNKETEYLIPLFDDVYGDAQIANPEIEQIEIYIIDTMHVNACALGRHTIAVTKGAVETFTDDELKGILAHEIGHIIYDDSLASLYSILANGLFTLMVVISRFFITAIEALSQKRLGVFSFAIFTCRIFFEILVFAFTFLMNALIALSSRKNEFRADEYAYTLGYGEDLTEALYLLQKMSLGENRKVVDRILASHPRISMRIGRLERFQEGELSGIKIYSI